MTDPIPEDLRPPEPCDSCGGVHHRDYHRPPVPVARTWEEVTVPGVSTAPAPDPAQQMLDDTSAEAADPAQCGIDGDAAAAFAAEQETT